MDRGILKEYLHAHEKEVVNSMIMLFEQEEATKRYGNRMRSEGKAEGLAEGRSEGRSEGRLLAYADMVADGTLTMERAAEKMGMTVEELQTALDTIRATA